MRWPWSKQPYNMVRHKMLYPDRSISRLEVHELKKRIKKRLTVPIPKRAKKRVRYRLTKWAIYFRRGTRIIKQEVYK